MGNSPCKEAGRFGRLGSDPGFNLGCDLEFGPGIRFGSPDSHIPRLEVRENSACGRLNTSKSGTIVITATNELASGGCGDIHANAGILDRITGDTHR
jgi:hypothetical protein